VYLFDVGERPWWLRWDGSPPSLRNVGYRQSRRIQMTTSTLGVVAIIWLPVAWEKVTGFLLALVGGLAAQFVYSRATRGRAQQVQQPGTT
jgi:hypothetical protein